MKRIILYLILVLAAISVSVSALTFTSVEEARTYVTNYVSPTYGTATIQEIKTTLDSNEYVITYLLSYTQDGEAKTETVNMHLYGELPEDSVIEEKLNAHALDYFKTVLDVKPQPEIVFSAHKLIGKAIQIKEPVTEIVEEPIEVIEK